MNPNFPNASQSFLDLNPHLDSKLSEPKERPRSEAGDDGLVRPELERRTPDGAVGQAQTKGGNTVRFLVRVTSVRSRLIDEDNLCEKFVVDCCRYAGLLPDDAPGRCRIEATQRKVKKGDPEGVLIEISELRD